MTYRYLETIQLSPGRKMFTDVTDRVKEVVYESSVKNGKALVYTPHTTTSVLINENEPRLLSDLAQKLEEMASCKEHYYHDDLEYRNCPPDEPLNGHSHCKSLYLSSSHEMIPVWDYQLRLGKWQSIFFVELESTERERNLQVLVEGK